MDEDKVLSFPKLKEHYTIRKPIARFFLFISYLLAIPFSKLAYLIYPSASVATLMVFAEPNRRKIRFAFYRELEFPKGIDLKTASKTGVAISIEKWREFADKIDDKIKRFDL